MAEDNQEQTTGTAEQEETAEEQGLHTTVTYEDDCRCVIEVEADADFLEKRYDEELEELQSQVTLPGFRQGKAPKGLVEKRLGSSVKDEVLSSVMTDAYEDAVRDNDLHVVAEIDVPDLDEYDWEVGQPATFEFTCEVLPSIELEEDDYKGLEIELPDLEVTDEMVEEEMENFAQRFADMEEVTDSGIDREDEVACTVSVVPDSDDEEPVWSGELGCQPVEKRIGPFEVEGLIGGLEGCKKGNAVTLAAKYDPQDEESVIEELEDRESPKLQIEVQIDGVYRHTVPEIDEEFTEEYGLPSPDEIENSMRENLEQQMQQRKDSVRDEMITEALLERVDLPLPDTLVERATAEQQRRIMLNALQQGESRDRAQQIAAQAAGYSREVAVRNLKRSYLMSEISEKERLFVTESDVHEQIRSLAARHDWDEEQAEQYLEENDMMDSMRSNLRENKVMDFLLENAEVKEIPREEWEARYSEEESEGE